MQSMIKFEGPLDKLCYDYVDFRHSIGYQMGYSSQLCLKKIVEVLYQYPIIDDVVDRIRAEEVAAQRAGESDSTRMGRYLVLRQFCLWLYRIGLNPYIPKPGPFRVKRNFVPRIISEEEMAQILTVAKKSTFAWAVMVLQILWCTGARIGEVAALKVGDFDRQNATLYIAHAKWDRSRIIPTSATLTDALANYIEDKCPYAEHTDWIFPGAKPHAHRNKIAIGNRLRELYRSAGVLTKEGKPIRTHDIRHSFAIRVLENMVEQGTDIYVALPYLSAFLGHANIFDTEYYLRLLPAHHQKIIDTQLKTSNTIFGVDVS